MALSFRVADECAGRRVDGRLRLRRFPFRRLLLAFGGGRLRRGPLVHGSAGRLGPGHAHLRHALVPRAVRRANRRQWLGLGDALHRSPLPELVLSGELRAPARGRHRSLPPGPGKPVGQLRLAGSGAARRLVHRPAVWGGSPQPGRGLYRDGHRPDGPPRGGHPGNGHGPGGTAPGGGSDPHQRLGGSRVSTRRGRRRGAGGGNSGEAARRRPPGDGPVWARSSWRAWRWASPWAAS